MARLQPLIDHTNKQASRARNFERERGDSHAARLHKRSTHIHGRKGYPSVNGKRTMSQHPRSALSLMLAQGDADTLRCFLAVLPPSLAACLSRVCREWALAAEYCLQNACKCFSWQLPRRARLQQRGALAELSWRNVFVARACRGCMAVPGDFAVRTVDAGAPRCFLCARCAKKPQIVQRLQRHSLTLDVTGLSGRPLYNGKESKFAAEVSMLSKDALDNASGARAEVLRHSGNGRRR